MKVKLKPIVVSPIPASTTGPVARPISRKRLSRLRMNWFVVGSVFGIGLSFFLNFVVSAVVVPQYERVLARVQGKAPTQLAAITETKPAHKPTPQPAVIAAAPTPTPTPAPALALPAYPRTLALEVGRGRGLLDLLLANQVQVNEAHNVVAALKGQVNPQQLKVGQKISVTLARHQSLGDKAAVAELAINLPNLSTVELQRRDNGSFNVTATRETLKTASYRGYGKVKTSLFQAGAAGGIPSATMNEIVKAFSYDVDFQRDIHPGDSVEVLMDSQQSRDGRVGSYGELRYAALTLRGKKKEIFRFKPAGGEFAWFDAKGNSIKKSLLRTPLDAARITSGFGLRTHPIMGYTKMHKGVDFGAPTGTPIMAAGDGTVTFKGWKGGYGNFVTIKHNATYETAYGHISRFANIKVGGRVKQGDVIAYVGMTGMSTGPHLHYELRQNSAQVNPVSKQFNLAQGLSGKQLATFKVNKTTIVSDLAALGGAPVKAAANTPTPAKKSVESVAKKTKSVTTSKSASAKPRTSKQSASATAKSKPLRVASR